MQKGWVTQTNKTQSWKPINTKKGKTPCLPKAWSHHSLTWWIWTGVSFLFAVTLEYWALEKRAFCLETKHKDNIFSTESQKKQTNTIFRTLYFIKDNDKKVQTFSWTTKKLKTMIVHRKFPAFVSVHFFIEPILHTSTNKIILSTLPLADMQWIVLNFLNSWLISNPLQQLVNITIEK